MMFENKAARCGIYALWSLIPVAALAVPGDGITCAVRAGGFVAAPIKYDSPSLAPDHPA